MKFGDGASASRVSDPIRRHLKHILKKSYGPTDNDCRQERSFLVFEMPIPRDGHELFSVAFGGSVLICLSSLCNLGVLCASVVE